MRYLLDTHIALWAKAEPTRLPEWTARIIDDDRNSIAFSVVAIWEAVIKFALRRPDFSVDPAALRAALLDTGFIEVPVTAAHVLGVGDLAPLHRDPFDRLMVAQAKVEGRRFLTTDRLLAGYGNWVEVV